MNSGKNVLKYLRDEGKNLEVPKSLEPEQMEKMLKQKTAQNTANKYKVRKIYHNFAAVAACLCGYCKKNTDITVKLKGGDLVVRYTDDGVFLSGNAEITFCGEIVI